MSYKVKIEVGGNQYQIDLDHSPKPAEVALIADTVALKIMDDGHLMARGGADPQRHILDIQQNPKATYYEKAWAEEMAQRKLVDRNRIRMMRGTDLAARMQSVRDEGTPSLASQIIPAANDVLQSGMGTFDALVKSTSIAVDKAMWNAAVRGQKDPPKYTVPTYDVAPTAAEDPHPAQIPKHPEDIKYQQSLADMPFWNRVKALEDTSGVTNPYQRAAREDAKVWNEAAWRARDIPANPVARGAQSAGHALSDFVSGAATGAKDFVESPANVASLVPYGRMVKAGAEGLGLAGRALGLVNAATGAVETGMAASMLPQQLRGMADAVSRGDMAALGEQMPGLIPIGVAGYHGLRHLYDARTLGSGIGRAIREGREVRAGLAKVRALAAERQAAFEEANATMKARADEATARRAAARDEAFAERQKVELEREAAERQARDEADSAAPVNPADRTPVVDNRSNEAVADPNDPSAPTARGVGEMTAVDNLPYTPGGPNKLDGNSQATVIDVARDPVGTVDPETARRRAVQRDRMEQARGVANDAQTEAETQMEAAARQGQGAASPAATTRVVDTRSVSTPSDPSGGTVSADQGGVVSTAVAHPESADGTPLIGQEGAEPGPYAPGHRTAGGVHTAWASNTPQTSRPQGRSSVGLADIQDALPGWDVVLKDDGNVSATSRSGRTIDVVYQEIPVDAATAAQTGATHANGEWVLRDPETGNTLDTDGLIKLARGVDNPDVYANNSDLFHEVFHAAMSMALSDKQMRQMIAFHGSDEAAAAYYANHATEFKNLPLTVETAFQRIKTWAHFMLRALTSEGRAENQRDIGQMRSDAIMTRVRTGKIWDQRNVSRGSQSFNPAPREAAPAPEPAAAPPPESLVYDRTRAIPNPDARLVDAQGRSYSIRSGRPAETTTADATPAETTPAEATRPDAADRRVRMEDALQALRSYSLRDRGAHQSEEFHPAVGAVLLDVLGPNARYDEWARAVREAVPSVSEQRLGEIWNVSAHNVDVGSRLSSVPLMEARRGIATNGTQIHDIAQALENRTRTILDMQDTVENRNAQRAVAMYREARWAIENNARSPFWYPDSTIALRHSLIARFPEIALPENWHFYRMILACTSFGVKPHPNFESATIIYDHFRRTGSLPLLNPESAGGEMKFSGNSITEQVKKLQRMLDRFKAVDPENPLKAMQEWMMREDLSKADVRPFHDTYGPVDTLVSGMYSIGPKGGAFATNLGGDPSIVTADMWCTRNFMRHDWELMERDRYGVIKVSKKGDPEIQSAPKDNQRRLIQATYEVVANQVTRDIIARRLEIMGDELHLDVANVQAALWWYEMQLYTIHGAESETQNYVTATERYDARHPFVPGQGVPSDFQGYAPIRPDADLQRPYEGLPKRWESTAPDVRASLQRRASEVAPAVPASGRSYSIRSGGGAAAAGAPESQVGQSQTLPSPPRFTSGG